MMLCVILGYPFKKRETVRKKAIVTKAHRLFNNCKKGTAIAF